MGFFDFFRSGDKPSAKEEEAARAALAKATRNLDIDVSIAAHDNWKTRLTAHLHNHSQHPLNPDDVADDHKCDLGKWIYSDGEALLGKYSTFTDLKAQHKMFHYTASSVVSLVQAGENAKAQDILEGEFTKLSKRVKQRLTDLKGL